MPHAEGGRRAGVTPPVGGPGVASNITITITKRLGLRGHRYHWSASSPNGTKLAAGKRGGHKDKHDAVHVLHLLFGPKFGGQKINDTTGEPDA